MENSKREEIRTTLGKSNTEQLRHFYLYIYETIKGIDAKDRNALILRNFRNDRAAVKKAKVQSTILDRCVMLLEDALKHNLVKWNPQKPLEISSFETNLPISVKVNKGIDGFDRLTKEITKTRRKYLKILDTWMPYILMHQKYRLEEWIQNCESIQILMLDPNSRLAPLRSASITDPTTLSAKRVTDEIIACLDTIFQIKNSEETIKSNCSIEVRLFDQIPGMNAFILPDKIYYGHFLSFDYSHRTLFHEHQITVGDFITKDILRHFETLWNNGKVIATDTDLEQLKNDVHYLDHDEAINRNRLLEKIADKYYVFNLDDEEQEKGNKFQQSVLIIDKAAKRCNLTIEGRKSKQNITYSGIIRSIGTDNLYFQFRKLDFFLSFIAYYGNDSNLLQGLYLHVGLNNKPLSSICLFVAATEDDHDLPSNLLPTRNDNLIDQSIKTFLIGNNHTRLNLNEEVRGFESLIRYNDNQERGLSKLLGQWAVYYPDRYEHTRPVPSDKYNLARARLDILKDTSTGTIYCEFASHDLPGKENHKVNLRGKPNLIEVNRKFYFQISLQQENDKRSVHLKLLIYIGGERSESNILNGTYNIIYMAGHYTGCGFVTLVKANEKEDIVPMQLDPLSLSSDIPDEQTRASIQHLCFEDSSSLIRASRQIQEHNELKPYAGIYKAYTYGQKYDENNRSFLKCIKCNVLTISQHGLALLREIDGVQVAGRMFLQEQEIGKNLFIEFKSDGSKKKRSGYIIVKVREPNFSIRKHVYFCGIYVGVSTEDEQPLARRIILEYVAPGEDPTRETEPFKAVLYSSEYNDLPEEIRRTLTGRFPNYIGFQRVKRGIFSDNELELLNSRRVDMGVIFLKTAIQDITEATSIIEEEVALKNLERAVFHGMHDLKSFTEAILDKEKRTRIQKNPNFLRLIRLVSS